ncbi:MAG: SpoIID/LytB domain protein [Cyanobacteria bacterium RYN_339]|nr:SpoIID/LytB domain protein [Cyanobacteria bacterium RYN_339]
MKKLVLAGVMLASLLNAPAPAWAVTFVRVGVVEGGSNILISSSVAADLLDERGRAVMRIGPRESWTATGSGFGVQIQGPNGKQGLFSGSLWLSPVSGAGIPLVFARRHWYRGVLELKPTGSGLNVVNRVPLEQYLYGVVPSEIPRSWPMAALKSQAVAARSYAIANLGKHRSRGFDVCDSDDCQVYTGASVENTSTNGAVDGTRGEVLVSGGKVIAAYFCSSAGGYTENSEDVWVRKESFIRAVPDYDQNSPHYTWYKNVSASSLAASLSRQGVNVGPLVTVTPLQRSYSGRVKTVQVVGQNGSRVVSGENFRIAAGLASTLFNVSARGSQPLAVPSPGAASLPAEFAFAGRGWGHGLGLSQWGAKSLGEKGYPYTTILAHYYPGSQLRRGSY